MHSALFLAAAILFVVAVWVGLWVGSRSVPSCVGPSPIACDATADFFPYDSLPLAFFFASATLALLGLASLGLAWVRDWGITGRRPGD